MARLPTLPALVAALAAAPFALGCGAELDPQSELTTLRVLAVQKDKPYAAPGDDIALSMLYTDASKEAGRPIQIGWFSGCVNPPGDIYAGCFAGAIDPSALKFEQGEGLSDFSFTLPGDIISSRPPSPDKNFPHYGLAFVFFAVCAGTLSFDFETGSFPIRCLDPDGRNLGSADFIAGYSSVYVFDGFTNQNPIVTGFSFNGKEVESVHACVGDSCREPPPSDDLPPELVVPRCADDGDPTLCKGFPVKPMVDPASAELDSVQAAAYGRNYQEQIWVSYFTTAGSLGSDTRLVNEPTQGWIPDYETDFFAPKDPGPVRVFAAVYDNRGGVAWSGLDLRVE